MQSSEMKAGSKVGGVRVLIHSFFIVPFLIAVFGLLLFALVKLITGDPPSPYEALETIVRGSETERWQAALDLAGMLNNPENVPRDRLFTDRLAAEYERSSRESKPYLRTYLALAMGATRDQRFETSLLTGLKDEDRASRLAAIRALGLTGGHQAEVRLQQLLQDPDDTIVLETVVALGRMGGETSIPVLKDYLDHPEANIRWDTAIALAKLGDRSGITVINDLLSRDYYEMYAGVDEREQDRAILVAIELASRLKDSLFLANLDQLAKSDPNLKITNAALEALKNFQ